MTKCITCLCLLLASTLAATSKEANIQFKNNWRIVGGKDAKDGAYPHQVSLRSFGTHTCGGSIVHPNWIITATHCVGSSPPSEFTIIVAGSNSLSKGGDEYKVRTVYYHENYDNYLNQNDVAILEVDKITFSEKIASIAVETEFVGGNEACILSGWGTTSLAGDLPDKLQEINLKTTTNEYCKSRHNTPIIHTEICTLIREGEGACHGDSGGPLIKFINGTLKLIGGVSWGRPCAKGYPDVYSRISSFVPWFNDKCNNCLNKFE